MKMLFVGDLHLGSRSEQVEEAAREKILKRAEEADLVVIGGDISDAGRPEQYARFMQYYLHFPVNLATLDQIMALEEHAEYRQMNLYPAEDSVKIIDGVLVVKMSEAEER